ncbi:N-end-recognizing protein Ubr1 [Schizosaccharomyces japonicus yFS275]|uniref:E3 ubiquitin-protein ligase n=1 Tax=Schizosaccharomyces japonicus (strain yFS275 / FY16936) TaxID=402676 RepID=B6K064_SCHJY|nr:N-end-recognizing protein Ubr1 [Schizosaccharomyces japonicus yFS275]EEB06214.1 N-end-recognizing protein Ubr1 [Schizosaccharomyces japonicus yFS275]
MQSFSEGECLQAKKIQLRKRLLHFLQTQAYKNEFVWTEDSKIALLKELYSALLCYDESFWTPYFLDKKPIITGTFSLRKAQGSVDGDEYKRGRAKPVCGHVFRKGEVIFRCKNCSLDSNSALCVRCFRASAHKKHETSFSISTGSGGCCDCGNAEAWKQDYQCEIHAQAQEPLDSCSHPELIPTVLQLGIAETFACAINFIIDVISCSPEKLKRLSSVNEVLQNEVSSRFLESQYGMPDEPCTTFSLVLWNDEKHSFKQFYEQITTAIEAPNNKFGMQMADVINTTGRAVVATSHNINDLLVMAQCLSQINLAVSIRSTRDLFREEACGVIIHWLDDLADSHTFGDRNYLRLILCSTLRRPWTCGLQNVTQTLQHAIITNPLSSLDETDTDTTPSRLSQSSQSSSASYSRSCWAPCVNEVAAPSFAESTKMDYLFLYDLKLWKSLRYKLQEMYLGHLVWQPNFREFMGIRIAVLYRQLAESFLLLDREPEHSVIFFSVQIFTIPQIAKQLVAKYDFLTTVNSALYTFFTDKNEQKPNFVDENAMIRTDSAAFHSRRYFHVFHHIQFLLGIESVQEIMRVDFRYLKQYISFLYLFQGMCPYVRAITQHVEWENDSWMYVLNVSLQIAKLCRYIGNVYVGLDTGSLAAAIQLLFDVILRPKFHNGSWNHKENLSVYTSTASGEKTLVDYDVASQCVSFHHPLHWLLSTLLSNYVGRKDTQKLWSDEQLLAVIEHPIRVCTWLSQMRAKLWVRNGTTLRDQAHHYRDLSFHGYTFAMDVLLIQVAMVYGNTDSVFERLVKAFQLTDQMTGNYFNEHKHYDLTQLTSMFEDFLLLIISLVSNVVGLENWSASNCIKYDLIHILCFGPLSYSEIVKRVSEHLLERTEFEEVLHTVADFKPPEGLNDTGLFTIKSECLDFVDPYNIHFSRNQREEAECILRRKYGKQQFLDENNVVYELYSHSYATPLTTRIVMCNSYLQTIWHALVYAYLFPTDQCKFEGLVNISLHAILLALSHETSEPFDFSRSVCVKKFSVPNGLRLYCSKPEVSLLTILAQLKSHKLFAFSRPRIIGILQLLQKRLSAEFEMCFSDSVAASIPEVSLDISCKENQEKEEKLKRARERKARILEQFRQQQKQFLENNADFNDYDSNMDINDNDENESLDENADLFLTPPSDTCLLCQEELKDKNSYGILVYVQRNSLLRYLPGDNVSYLSELLELPSSLDRKVSSRPFGVAGMKKKKMDTLPIEELDDDCLKGFPSDCLRKGLQVTSCGHYMHTNCFKTYVSTVNMTTRANPYRNHPHNLSMKEFLCPLCKSLCNSIFLLMSKPHKEKRLSECTGPDAIRDWITNRVYLERDSLQTDDLFSSDCCLSLFSIDVLQQRLRNTLKEQYVSSFTLPQENRIASRTDTLRVELSSCGSESSVSSFLETHKNYEYVYVTEGVYELYRRLEDVLDLNLTVYTDGFIIANGKLVNVLELYSYTLACTEVSQRGTNGVDKSQTMLWFEVLTPSQLVFLRVLSVTVMTYAALSMNDFRNGLSGTSSEYATLVAGQHYRLFGASVPGFFSTQVPNQGAKYDTLLSKDIFTEFAEASVSGFLIHEESFITLTKCYYLADTVKTIWFLLKQLDTLKKCPVPRNYPVRTPQALLGFKHLVYYIWRYVCTSERMNQSPEDCPELNNASFLSMLLDLTEKFALVFLRKCALLWYVRYGIHFDTFPAEDLDKSEMDRITKALDLPTVTGNCNTLLQKESLTEWKLIEHWCQSHIANSPYREYSRVYTPSIYELVPLPREQDLLFELLLGRTCSKCQTEPLEPAICLFCGQVLCFQSHCCSFNGVGECSLHLQQCASNIGIYFIVKRCCILFLNPPTGSFAAAPFTDLYGEADLGLRRGRSQFLRQDRYDAFVRNVWIQGGVSSYIARRLDLQVDIGGWETL